MAGERGIRGVSTSAACVLAMVAVGCGAEGDASDATSADSGAGASGATTSAPGGAGATASDGGGGETGGSGATGGGVHAAGGGGATGGAGGGPTGPEEVWFVGDTIPILHYDGQTVAPSNAPSSTYYRLWGASRTDVFAVRWDGEVLRWDGGAWATSHPGPVPGLQTFQPIFGTSASDVWVVGGNILLHFNGTSWTSTTTGSITNWATCFWGTAPNDVWALGYSPNDHHWNGTQWTNVPNTRPMYLFAVWAASADDVWGVGQTLNIQGGPVTSSTIAHYNGASWSLADVPADMNAPGMVLRSVWGTSADEVWAVGDDGLAAHYDGEVWTRVDLGTTSDLQTVMGNGAGIVWAAGSGGTILRRDASGWGAIASGTTHQIHGLWVVN